MFRKEETKQAASSSTPSIEELAHKVKDNAARVELQREEIKTKEYRLLDSLNKPEVERTQRPRTDSFDVAEIENQAKTHESGDAIFAKVRALDYALEQPPCCDREYLNSIWEYLQAIRPEVDTLEGKQWELIRKVHELSAQIQQLNQEYAAVDQEIEDLLKVAHISHWGREYDKQVPMNGLWGISDSKPVTGLIDDAIGDCQDGKKYAIGKYFSVSVTPLQLKIISL